MYNAYYYIAHVLVVVILIIAIFLRYFICLKCQNMGQNDRITFEHSSFQRIALQ